MKTLFKLVLIAVLSTAFSLSYADSGKQSNKSDSTQNSNNEQTENNS